ncbi:MAG: FKBP-type peptidylprolyl isomerase [Chitinophagaceae bacterium]|nr:MAG: FKBP-type peptidylprolyl isomerase [Chitinophagaceae bacterium]
MRSLLLALVMVTATISGCKKEDSCPEDNRVAPASEAQQIEDYLSANSISATKHKSNMYYQVITPGTGGFPGGCSAVEVSYIGRFTSGAKFEESNGTAFRLDGLISGWKQGIPLIQKGGTIRLIIPPSLAYGPNDVKDRNGNVVIPGNSILIFDITLMDFQ